MLPNPPTPTKVPKNNFSCQLSFLNLCSETLTNQINNQLQLFHHIQTNMANPKYIRNIPIAKGPIISILNSNTSGLKNTSERH